jgi:hypothetical protein
VYFSPNLVYCTEKNLAAPGLISESFFSVSPHHPFFSAGETRIRQFQTFLWTPNSTRAEQEFNFNISRQKMAPRNFDSDQGDRIWRIFASFSFWAGFI